MQTVAQRLQLHVVYHLVDKSILQKQTGFLQRDTTLAHVEECRIIQLSHRRTVGTFHVVGINLQHRLGVHTCLLRGREVLVRHLRGSLLSAMLYQHPAGKGTHRLIVEHILIKFVGCAMRHLMCYQRVIVHMLFLVSYHTTIALALSPLARECQVELIACHTIMQRDDIMRHTTVALLVNIHIAYTYILIMRLLQTVEVQRSVLAHEGLYHLRGQEVAVISGMVAEQHLDFCPLFHHDEHTTVHHQVGHHALRILGRCLQDINHLNGTVNLHVLRHIHQQAILRQHRVKCGNGILTGLSQLRVVLAHQLRIVTHRADNHTLRQMSLWFLVVEKHIVHHKIETGTQVGHVTMEGLVGIHRNLQTIDVHTKVRLKELLDIGVFIAFHLFRWETLLAKVLKSLITHSVHRL